MYKTEVRTLKGGTTFVDVSVPSWYDEQDIKDDWRSFRYRAIRALCAHRGVNRIGRLSMETYIWRGNEIVAVRFREH